VGRRQALLRQVARATLELDREAAPDVDLALRVDLGAVQADQLVHERKPDAGAFVGSGASALHPMKTLENVG
jgi:hypothetical protein